MTLDDPSGSLLELLRPRSAIARPAQAQSVEQLEHALGSGAILRVVGPLAPARVDREAQRAASQLDQQLRRWLPESAYAPWHGRLDTVVAQAAPLSGQLREPRTALLTPVGGGTSDASLVWFLGGAALPTRLHLVALVASGARRRRSRVGFEADVHCELCQRPQYAAGHELQSLGARGLAQMDVAPICRECLGSAARDPELWERRRVRRAGAGLRLIAGERRGPVPWKDRRRFRIVRGE